jgi:hypothetical protein
VAEHLISNSEDLGVDLGKKTKTVLQKYFAKFGQVAAEEDLRKLNHLFEGS